VGNVVTADRSAASMTEKQFQDKVVAYAILNGWLVHHVKPGMTGRGQWLTNVQGHTGFPDLVLAHPGRWDNNPPRGPVRPQVIFAELKAENGRLSDNQKKWYVTLGEIKLWNHDLLVELWRPSDWPRVEALLSGNKLPGEPTK
jgi:hypothetical protein